MTGKRALALVRAHSLVDLIKLVTIKIANDASDGITVRSETPTHTIVVQVKKSKRRKREQEGGGK